MKRKDVVEAYTNMKIKSPDDLYDYVIKHDEAFINDIRFDLTLSNQVMEFMAIFLSMSKYHLLRLYFEKELSNGETFRHWFLILKDGERWYYFEPLLDECKGQYGFDSYNEVMFFVVNKLNHEFNELNTHYILKEITPLTSFGFEENIKQSLDGTDIFINNSLVPKEKEEFKINKIKNFGKKGSNFGFNGVGTFILSFFITIGLCIFITWIILNTKGNV